MDNLISYGIEFAYAGIMLSYFLAFIRLVKGPTLADRVVSLDLISFLAIGLIVVYAIDRRNVEFLDIAIALALVAFLATIAFARFIMHRYEDKNL